jgi:hypothetical protein
MPTIQSIQITTNCLPRSQPFTVGNDFLVSLRADTSYQWCLKYPTCNMGIRGYLPLEDEDWNNLWHLSSDVKLFLPGKVVFIYAQIVILEALEQQGTVI